MKKILILSASPRKGGNSDMLCDQFAKGAHDKGHQVEKLRLPEKKIGYCTGCGNCFDGKGCPQKDAMPEVLQKMVAAHAIVMATPVYFYAMNGQMKTLIDRTCARYREISGKEFYFIVTAADGSKAAMQRTLKGFRGFTYCLDGAKEMGVLYGVGAWKAGDVAKTAAFQQAYAMGQAA